MENKGTKEGNTRHMQNHRDMYIHVPSKKATSDPESEMEGWLIHLPPPYLRLDDFMLCSDKMNDSFGQLQLMLTNIVMPMRDSEYW